MATIQDYMTEKVCEQIKQAFLVFDSVEGSLRGNRRGCSQDV